MTITFLGLSPLAALWAASFSFLTESNIGRVIMIQYSIDTVLTFFICLFYLLKLICRFQTCAWILHMYTEGRDSSTHVLALSKSLHSHCTIAVPLS